MLKRKSHIKGLLCATAVAAGLGLSLEASAATGTAYIAETRWYGSADASLYQLDLASGNMTFVGTLDNKMHAMTFDDVAGTLYAVGNNSYTNNLVVIDRNTASISVKIGSLNDRMTGIAWHNDFIYTMDNDRDLWRIDPNSWTQTFLWDVSGNDRGLASDGTNLYHSRGGNLYIESTASDSQTFIGNLSGYDRAIRDMSYNPEGDTLIGIDRSGGIFEINKSTAATTTLYDKGGIYGSIAVMPYKDDDGDGMNDYWEDANGLDSSVDDSALDPDGDGLTNLEEYNAGSKPQLEDTDGDGLTDGEEVNQYGTSPAQVDSDGDNLGDALEVKLLGTDPTEDNNHVAQTSTSGYEQHADSAVDGNGNIHIVFLDDNYDVAYRMLDADGNTLVDTTTISDDTGGMPAVAVSGDNHVYVTWTDDENWGSENEISFARLQPYELALDGSSSTQAALVLNGPVYVTADDNEESYHSRIAVDAGGGAHLVWTDDIDSTVVTGAQETVRYTKLNADGSVAVAERELGACEDSYRCAEPDIMVDSDGEVHIVAASDPAGGDHYSTSEVMYWMLDGASGADMIGRSILTDAKSRGMRARFATISQAPEGRLNIVWQEADDDNNGGSNDFRLMRIDPGMHAQDGSSANAGVLAVYETELQTSLGRPRHPYARTDASGNITLTYQDGYSQPGNITDAHMMVVDSLGNTLFDRSITTPNADWWTIVKVSLGGTYVVVATDDNGIDVFKTPDFSDLASALTVPDGIRITMFTFDNIPADAQPVPAMYEDDVYGAVIEGLTAGQSVTLSINTVGSFPEGSTFKVWTEAGGWQDFAIGSDDGDGRITVTLVDGGPADADGTADGTLVLAVAGVKFISDTGGLSDLLNLAGDNAGLNSKGGKVSSSAFDTTFTLLLGLLALGAIARRRNRRQ